MPALNPLVSVIMPCYNQATYLPEAIASICAQTYPHWECIIINDGSTDNTKAIAETLEKNDSRIRIIHQQNKGSSYARNAGLDNAKGEFIQFLDADDLIEAHKFELQLTAISNSKNSEFILCYSEYRHCPEDNAQEIILRGNSSAPRFIMDNPLHDMASRWETEFSIPIHCFLFDAVFFREKAIRFNEALPSHEDWDCWMQIFSLNPVTLFSPEILAIYRLNKDGKTTDNYRMWIGFKKAIIKYQYTYRHDPVMHRLLSNKLQEMKKVYFGNQPPILSSKLFIKLSKAYKQFMPWPIQKLINSLY